MISTLWWWNDCLTMWRENPLKAEVVNCVVESSWGFHDVTVSTNHAHFEKFPHSGIGKLATIFKEQRRLHQRASTTKGRRVDLHSAPQNHTGSGTWTKTFNGRFVIAILWLGVERQTGSLRLNSAQFRCGTRFTKAVKSRWLTLEARQQLPMISTSRDEESHLEKEKMEEIYSQVLQVAMTWRDRKDCEHRCARLLNQSQRARVWLTVAMVWHTLLVWI